MVTRIAGLFSLIVLLATVPNALAVERQARFGLDAQLSLNAYTALAEQEFEHARTGLRVLAASENALSGDWERIKGPLAVLAKDTPINAAVWFAKPDGSYFTVESGPTEQNLKDREYFPELLAGKEVAGGLVVSRSTGKRSAIVAVPVQAGGRVIGALGVSLAMEKLGAAIDDKIGFPAEMMFYALDENGQIGLHRQSTLLFEFAEELGSPTLTAAVKEMLAKPEGVVHYEFQGAERVAIFKKSGATGWVFALRW